VIVFIEKGRLGNQLFQYAALKTLCRPGERLLLMGFDELRRTFDGIQATFVLPSESRVFRHLSGRRRATLERALRRLGLMTVIGERFEKGRHSIHQEAGWGDHVRYCEVAYFQSESAFNRAVLNGVHVRPHLAQPAAAWLAGLCDRSRPRVFVHVRRGDYRQHPTPEHPAMLPGVWYRECMARMRGMLDDPIFVLCSDEPSSLAEFDDVSDAVRSRNDQVDDFAMMTQCDSGILSPSSYSWWGAWFAHRNRGGGAFLAPEFWLGHPVREWMPPGIESSFLQYA
jgi:hypothetical protein